MTDSSLASALAVVQEKLPRIEKTKTARVQTEKANYTYSYADLAQVSAAILPLLGANGLAWMTKPTFNAEGKFVLAYALLHGASGEREEGEFPIPSSGSPHAVGSAITYARRYALCAVTGVAPDQDDDDAARASEETRSTRRVRPPRKSEEPDDRPRTTVRRQQQRPPTASQPPLPGEEGRVSEDQLKAMATAFEAVGITDGSGWGKYVQDKLNREVRSLKELSQEEATTVLEALLAAVEPSGPPGEEA